MLPARYIPSLRYHVLTRFYDRVGWVTTRDRTVKRMLVEQVGARPGEHVLDLGCGTGTLAAALAYRNPAAATTGVDADVEALVIAQGKAKRAGILGNRELGRAEALPFVTESFDRVASEPLVFSLDEYKEGRGSTRGAVRAQRTVAICMSPLGAGPQTAPGGSRSSRCSCSTGSRGRRTTGPATFRR
ncbi:MAG: methyltransferase domain-containing protein [Burkholderiales bacterium]|nr:methyltransferase domain-containing protein [Burkholderiales bacterium]